ncbi:hypothetical protein B0H17DRAFT_1125512 [Mycena rosella]|uniref:Uncharacterized protein n=1 Tax=Mycena rosella TaxID=1033263 RepID=A0AAD7GWB0_MYCRO|nr:hypothetical protein B0H17DRAFT_1125512 [Mycena rosella]
MLIPSSKLSLPGSGCVFLITSVRGTSGALSRRAESRRAYKVQQKFGMVQRTLSLEMVQQSDMLITRQKHVTFHDPVTGRCILDITSAPNHTSEAQMAGWKTVLQEGLVDTFNASPIDIDEVITLIKVLEKFARLMEQWITISHPVLLGRKYLSSHDLQHYLPEIQRHNDLKIQAAGGIDAWNALSEQEKTRRDTEVCRA